LEIASKELQRFTDSKIPTEKWVEPMRKFASEALTAIGERRQKLATLSRRHPVQTKKSSTQFLHRSKMVYFC
jgi:hypothetical protein